MFDAANILINWHPAVRVKRIKRRVSIMRVGIAQIIPARTGKRIHRIGFATRRRTTFRACARSKTLMRCERFSLCQVDVFRKHNWQIGLGNRHDTTLLTVNCRNRIAPIALPANKPIAQTILHFATSAPDTLKRGNHYLFSA